MRGPKSLAAIRRMPAGLKRYWRKKLKARGGGHHTKKRKKGHHHVAKKRKGRRGHHKRRHHRRHRRHGDAHSLMMWGIGGAAIGLAESKAKADSGFILNKLPRPVTALGYTGGTTLALWAIDKFLFPHRYLKLAVKVGAGVTGYQLGKQGKQFDSVAIQGDDFMSGDEHYLDEHTMGALEEEMGAVAFDEEVHNALAHT